MEGLYDLMKFLIQEAIETYIHLLLLLRMQGINIEGPEHK